MDLQTILSDLQSLSTEQTKKTYKNHGAQEPLFGVPTGAMKPLMKKTGRDYDLSMALYATGNYDAQYFAGMIAEPKKMCAADFETWMKTAYCAMQSDYVVAVTLAEADCAQTVADCWIESGKELYMSAGWSCYCWLLGVRLDDSFDKDKLQKMLHWVGQNIHFQPNRTKYSMNDFVIAVGISYIPLHEEALLVAEQIGTVTVDMGKTSCKTPIALNYIQKAVDKGRLGFKRKNVRC